MSGSLGEEEGEGKRAVAGRRRDEQEEAVAATEGLCASPALVLRRGRGVLERPGAVPGSDAGRGGAV